MSNERKPKAPAHLQDATKRWWRSVVKEYRLEEHHVKLLTLAAEALDRAQEARERLTQDGSYVTDRFHCLRAHPAVAVERDAKILYARLLRDLDLDIDAPPARPPQPPLLRRYGAK